MLEDKNVVIEVKRKEEDGSFSGKWNSNVHKRSDRFRGTKLEQERVVPFLENGSFITPTSETFVEYLKSNDEIKV